MPERHLPRRSRTIGTDREAQRERIAFFGIEERDVQALERLRKTAASEVEGLVDRFYDHLLAFPELETLLRADPERLTRLRATQRNHFLSILDGALTPGYFESRLRVGDAHQRIGLEPHWYIGAYSQALVLALRLLAQQRPEPLAALPAAEALIKHVFLDISLAIDTYITGGFVTRAVARDLERAAVLAEESLRSMAEVDRMKDELASMVVHDLKNPVNGISMLVQLVLRKGGELPANVRGWLLQIDRTCREMTRLIQNLLEIAKLEEGRMPVLLEPVVVRDLVTEILAEFGPLAGEAGRLVVCEVPPDLPEASADRQLLRRVLANLVVNALRHSGSPEVRIWAGVGAPDSLGDDASRQIEIRVVDRGRGFTPEEQERIFEKFRAVRRSPADDPGGDTGLGLPFCRLAVEQMGGQISISSVPGKETVFSIHLAVG